MNDNNIIDLGEVQVPESWNDVTLAKYQQIERFYADKDKKFNVIDVLDIIIDKNKDYIMNLPAEFLNIILDKLQFILTPPKEEKPTNKIEISGETYIINVQNKLKTGEWVAAEMVMKDDKHNYAAILAILCRKQDEIYDSKFENEILEDRIKLFEKQPVTKILPIINFFLSCYMMLELPSQLSTKVEEELNHIRKHIENSEKIGVCKKRYLIWRAKKLQKLLKSIKNT